MAVTFGIVGLYAWVRKRPVLAGVLLGLGTATKLFPGFILEAIALVALSTRDRVAWRATGLAWAAGVGSYIGVNLVPAVLWRPGWWYFFQFSKDRGAESNSLWYHASAHFPTGSFWGWLGDPARDIPALNLLVGLLLLIGLAAIGFLAWRAPVPPRLAQIAFLVLFVFLTLALCMTPQEVYADVWPKRPVYRVGRRRFATLQTMV